MKRHRQYQPNKLDRSDTAPLIWERISPPTIQRQIYFVSYAHNRWYRRGPIERQRWCRQNYLLLNPDKTELLVFGSRQKLAQLGDVKFSLLGKELLPVPSGKDLGVILDNNLTYDDHITKNVSLRFSRLAQINRVKHAFNKKILINIIYTLVFSKLLYCSNVWAYTSQERI